MNSPKTSRPRWLYVVYIVGIATLAVSMVGASWMLRGNAGTTGASGSSAETAAKAYCVGNVDVEGGMMFPYPSQPGRVVEVKVSEGQGKVKAGDVLFRMDDRREREDLKAAEEGRQGRRGDVRQGQ